MADENTYKHDISEQLNDAVEQKTGEVDLAELDYKDLVATVVTQEQKEEWVKALTNRIISTKYLVSEYAIKNNDIFYEDAEEYGAIAQVIDIEMPEAIANRSWIDVTSGETTIGCNTIYLPIVDEKLYAGMVGWEIPMTITGIQMNQAFTSASGLRQFRSYLETVTRNAINYRKQVMSGINRNNYIASKIVASRTQGTDRVHKVNLVAEYLKYTGGTSMTVKEYLTTPDAIRFSAKTFEKYLGLMQEMSVLFTTKANSKGKFVPKDRLVFQLLKDFRGLMDTYVYSDTYHNEFVDFPLYREVSSWQALTSASASADFEVLSSINVALQDGTTVNQSGIVGVMLDKWSVMHTTIQNRVGVQHDDIKNITLYAHQFTDRFMNNLTLNGVVFTVEDV